MQLKSDDRIQVAWLWQRDRVTHAPAIVRGWVNFRLNFKWKGYVSSAL